MNPPRPTRTTPPTASPTPVTQRPRLRLVVVPTPQPPLEDERLPVRLVLPGIAAPRPVHRPGPPPPAPPRGDARLPVRLVLPGIAAPRPVHRPGPRPRFGPDVARVDDDFG